MQINIQHAQTGRQATVGRRLGQRGAGDGPTLVVIAGIHGNEPSGIFAFLQLLAELDELNCPIKGRIVGLAGNLAALQRGVRFIDVDLNRIWGNSAQNSIKPELPAQDGANPASENLLWESRERSELYSEILTIMKEGTGPFYFVDLHTTSSESPPFMPLDDTLRNRDFVCRFPVPAVLGLEEVLPGTLLSHLNEFDVVTCGYEAGQHDSELSITLHREMLWCALEYAGCLKHHDPTRVEQARQALAQHSAGLAGFYEVTFRFGLEAHDDFQMRPNYRSFQSVQKGETLAERNQTPIRSPYAGLMFMPLYQSKGNDGFFLVRPISSFWLTLSRWCRNWRLERSLGWLPGVHVPKDDVRRIQVDLRVARFLAKQIFHLLGYRKVGESETHLFMARREK